MSAMLKVLERSGLTMHTRASGVVHVALALYGVRPRAFARLAVW